MKHMVPIDPATVLLQTRDIVKTFPGVRALDGVAFDVVPGEVHCLLGQNGAGKSTLIKVLSGAYQPTSGTIEIAGEQVQLSHPIDGLRRGVATMYQELDVVDGLSVAENIFLGHELATLGLMNRRELARRSRELLARLGHGTMPIWREVGTLSAANKQIVAMARALSHDARVIIMDEPSAVLDSGEVANLFRVVRELTAQGIAIIYISHRLEEIREIGDRITVLKDGKTVASGLPVATTPTSELIRLMTGRNVEYAFGQSTSFNPGAPVMLEVQDLSAPEVFTGINFQVRAGEIYGLAGLVGSGRSEILEAIYGARRPDNGQVRLKGKVLRPGSVGAAVRAGMGFAPEERKSQGLLLDEPVYRNITLATFARFARSGWLNERAERAASSQQAESLDIRPRGITRPIRNLSGGNQQKAMLARWLVHGCDVLLLDEPTRGVDVGARSEIYDLIRTLAAAGAAIVVVSSELPEVLGLADTIGVIAEGRLIAQLPAAQITEEAVLDLVMEGHVA